MALTVSFTTKAVVLEQGDSPKERSKDLSGVCVTGVDQVKIEANKIVEDAKPKDYLGVERNNFTLNKFTQCSGTAHNKDQQKIETNDWVLVARRRPKDAKLNGYLDVGVVQRLGVILGVIPQE